MTKKTKIKERKKAEVDANLDEALAETFPASDPPSMIQPRTRADVPQKGARRHLKGVKCGAAKSRIISNLLNRGRGGSGFVTI
jgi:hypothetical protein